MLSTHWDSRLLSETRVNLSIPRGFLYDVKCARVSAAMLRAPVELWWWMERWVNSDSQARVGPPIQLLVLIGPAKSVGWLSAWIGGMKYELESEQRKHRVKYVEEAVQLASQRVSVCAEENPGEICLLRRYL